MQHVISSILPIFLITILGSFIKKYCLSSEEFWRGTGNICYFLFFPLMLFKYVAHANFHAFSLIKIVSGLIISTIIISAVLIFYQYKTKESPEQFTSIFQGSVRYNSYIFLALGSALFDDETVTIISIVSSYMIIFTNLLTIGIFAIYIPNQFKGDNILRNFISFIKLVFTNPLIIATIIGFIFNYANLHINLGVTNTISTLANAALPLSMLNIGANLKFSLKLNQSKKIILTCCLKLVAMPVVTTITLYTLNLSYTEKLIGILYSCLPCASSSYLLSIRLGGDCELMNSIITSTTIAALLSLTIFMYIFV